MKTFLKVVIFSVAVILFYAFYANVMIPQVRPAPPPAEAKLDMGSLTMEQFIHMGDEIFHGKGTCELCHNPVGGRAPLLDQVGKIAEERIKDPRYKGKAKTTSGAIGLKPFEVDAVIAYFQQKAGVTVTVQLPKETPAASEEAHVAAPAKTGEEVVTKYGCGACHKIAGQQGALGPDLTKIGAKKNKDYLRRAVLNPNADIAPGFPAGMMPPDFGTKMLSGE
ncbi:MAG: c-type cytochrome, partial [Deltaproteobacteria bacterium]|nr:c-type cytochrome [Deltaproteobacteria bacterium]